LLLNNCWRPIAYGFCLQLIMSATASADVALVRHDLQRLLSRQSATVGLLGLGLAAIAKPLDDDLRGSVGDNSLLNLVFDADRLGGSSTNGIAATVGVWGLASLTGRPQIRAVSSELLRALVLANALVLPLKEIVGRERPDGEDLRSFPSGHSANAFAIATILARRSGSGLRNSHLRLCRHRTRISHSRRTSLLVRCSRGRHTWHDRRMVRNHSAIE
jgi:membrane-associated phospholipid phosphatase